MARRWWSIPLVVAVAALLAALPAAASHSWSGYHWARTTNPFALTAIDSVTSTWDAYLGEAAGDWSQPPAASLPDVLDVGTVAGATDRKTRRRCPAASGKVRVCNDAYGNTGWLGVAQIWVSGSHIAQGTVKVNDTYFSTATYDTPAWRRLVMCQEVGHTLGLDHQDESFSNPNLGTCMDYTSDPDGPPSNEHPNAHDYEQLGQIYEHGDSFNSYNSSALPASGKGKAKKVKDSLWVEDLGNGQKLLTWILWTSPQAAHGPPFADD